MFTVPLGSSSRQISRLAYGCWRIARMGNDAADLKIARDAIEAALDAGYTLFDHADIYCGGRAELMFGRVLKDMPGVRDQIVIASKAGIRFSGDTGPHSPYRYDCSRGYLVAQCERSLRSLQVDTIDLFQIHRPDYLMQPEEVAAAFDQLEREGKVREFGVSNFSPAQTALLQSALNRPLVVNQIELSLCQLDPFSDGTLDQCQEKKITPLAWSPLGGGLLAHGATDILRHQRAYQVADLVGTLNEVADALGETRDVIAIAWLLRHPSGIVPIIGSVQPGRIRAAAHAASIELSREAWYQLFASALGGPLP
jgi:predicted oxidoreductase